MRLHPNAGMISRMERTHKAGRLSQRVCGGIQEGGDTLPLWAQSRVSQHLQGLILDQTESGGKKLWAQMFPLIEISGENRTGPGKQST